MWRRYSNCKTLHLEDLRRTRTCVLSEPYWHVGSKNLGSSPSRVSRLQFRGSCMELVFSCSRVEGASISVTFQCLGNCLHDLANSAHCGGFLPVRILNLDCADAWHLRPIKSNTSNMSNVQMHLQTAFSSQRRFVHCCSPRFRFHHFHR